MGNASIIEIGMNDSLEDVIRKCNANFKRVSFDQSKNTKSRIQMESDETDEAIQNARKDAQEHANALHDDSVSKIDDLRQSMEHEDNRINNQMNTIQSIVSKIQFVGIAQILFRVDPGYKVEIIINDNDLNSYKIGMYEGGGVKAFYKGKNEVEWTEWE